MHVHRRAPLLDKAVKHLHKVQHVQQHRARRWWVRRVDTLAAVRPCERRRDSDLVRIEVRLRHDPARCANLAQERVRDGPAVERVRTLSADTLECVRERSTPNDVPLAQETATGREDGRPVGVVQHEFGEDL